MNSPKLNFKRSIIVQCFPLIENNIILFQRNDNRKKYGSVSGTFESTDSDLFSTVIREVSEETGICISRDDLFQSSFSIECLSPNARNPILIYPFACKIPKNNTDLFSIVLNTKELISYQIMNKNDALEFIHRNGEVETYSCLDRMIKEGLL